MLLGDVSHQLLSQILGIGSWLKEGKKAVKPPSKAGFFDEETHISKQ
jgi:hypothetical protein